MKQRQINIRHLTTKDLPAPNAINEALSGRKKTDTTKGQGISSMTIKNLGDLAIFCKTD